MSEAYCKLIENLKLLSKEIDLPVFTEINLRCFGPKEKEDIKMKLVSSDVIIENIPEEINELELIPLCLKYGAVIKFCLMLNSDLLGHSNVAYCTYKSSDLACKCVSGLNNYEILPDRKIRVKRLVENCTLFIGNVRPEKTKEEILYALIKAGMVGVKDVITYKSYSNPNKTRGFAFVPFHTRELAEVARNTFKNNLTLFGKNIAVEWGNFIPEVDDQLLEHIEKVFLRNLKIKDDRITFCEEMRNVLGQNRIRRIYKYKDYAFIHFTTREEAMIGKNLLSEYYKDDIVEVSWGIPPEAFDQFAIITERNALDGDVYQKLRSHFENYWFESTKNLMAYGKKSEDEEISCNCLLPHKEHFEFYYKTITAKIYKEKLCPLLKLAIDRILCSLDMDFF